MHHENDAGQIAVRTVRSSLIREASKAPPRAMFSTTALALTYMLDDQVFTERQQATKQPGTAVPAHAEPSVRASIESWPYALVEPTETGA